MSRMIALTMCSMLILSGCADRKSHMMAGPPQQLSPGSEMDKLKRFVGSWKGTAEFVSPTIEEMRAAMPEGAGDMPDSFAGGGDFEMVLGGMFMKGEGWHEMGGGTRATYIEYWTWDDKANKYHTFFFSVWGECGEGWAEFQGPDLLKVKAKGRDALGNTKSGSGTMRFVDSDTLEWTWTEKSGMGKMKFKGTSRRQR